MCYACYSSGQSLLASRLLSNNVNIDIRKTISLPVVVVRYETLSLTLKEHSRLRGCLRVLSRMWEEIIQEKIAYSGT
jgi:hypothetical protein